MFSKLAEIESRYEQLMAEMATPAVQGDVATFRSHSKALAEMQPLVDSFRRYKEVIGNINAAEELLKDPDMRVLAEGLVARGDAFELVAAHADRISITAVNDIIFDRSIDRRLMERLVEMPEFGDSGRTIFARRLAKMAEQG